MTKLLKSLHLKVYDYNKPHGRTIDSNKPNCLLIWLTHIPNKPSVLNKATGCYIPQSRVGENDTSLEKKLSLR